jgi:cobalamin transport system substrate-binding protein
VRVFFPVVLLAVLAGATAPAPPRRVISLAPSLTEIVFALGAGDRLVGVTRYCDVPQAAKALPRIGGMEDGSIDFERVLHLRPDLVLAIGEDQETAVATLKRLGARVEVVTSQTVDDTCGAVTRVGALLGREEAARSLRAELERRVARVRAAVAALPAGHRPRVFYEVWDHPLMTGTRRSLAGQLIELAGGENIFADLSGRYVEVSPEAVLARNPQVILAPDHHALAVALENLARRPGFARVDAVRNGRIRLFDGNLISRPGPRIAFALEQVARALHPDLFPGPPPPTAKRP